MPLRPSSLTPDLLAFAAALAFVLLAIADLLK
jgi:hypothetical protein